MNRLPGLLLALALPIVSLCQKKTVTVVVMGSSTAWGAGANPIDSSWANLCRFYWDSLGVLDTLYNIADPGTTSDVGMPTGWIPPGYQNSPPNYPNPLYNITEAMSLNPDVVIICYPSNDVEADIPPADFLSNMRAMYNIVTGAGKICYITTTEPRDGLDSLQDSLQIQSRDSVIMEFGKYALDFYDIVRDPNPLDSLSYNPALTPDGTHPNNTGHRLLYNYVHANANLGVPLPPALLDFTAVPRERAVEAGWATTSGAGPLQFDLERSADGKVFTPVYQEQGKGAPGTPGQTYTYNWTDNYPFPGNNFYRLAMIQNGNTMYSTVVLASLKPLVLTFLRPGGLIGNVFMQSATNLEAQISTQSNTNISLSVYAATGDLVAHQSTSVPRFTSLVSISLPGVASGVYYLRVLTADGQSETRAFFKL